MVKIMLPQNPSARRPGKPDQTAPLPAETEPIHNEPKQSRRSIGPYKILATIGEGGMGAVYLAEEERPVRRKVAVKLIKAGMDSRAIIARFEAERQALALMDHPNIAKILGSGTTDDGRPYFAMEYVKGITLTDYCHTHKLTILHRLDLFRRICHAVQHAHQKAIIHRDLKPGNILVTDQDGNPVPKIIDFGLAKALGGQRLTEQTFFTTQGVMMGTPEYMSPEQANPSALDIDTRTDVYSLGVILYQLLAGVLPIELKGLRAEAQMAALEAVRRKICDEEPQKPSTRIGSSPDFGSQIAALRQMDRSGLMRKLKGDLDWITMKALEKDRNRRYATAYDLAADIDRHLNHEPVSAGPPSRGYILKKFVRKNLGLVASLALILIALLAGGVTATVFYIRAEKASQERAVALDKEREARKQAERERKRAQDSETSERGERKKADLARKKAEAAEQKAERAQSEAERQRDEVLRLSDIKKLSEIRDAADRLWPSYPLRIKAMEAWLDDARRLTGNLDEHRQTLVRLREEAVSKPQDGENGPSDDEENETSTEWKFINTESQWRHDVLAELVDGLERFVDPDAKIGLIADVGERLVFARTVREVTVEKYNVEWDEAIASIGNEEECAAYKGLVIKPHIGLVPIGRDRESGLWEFAHIQTGEIPRRREGGKLVLTVKIGLVFVLLPGGTFLMGSRPPSPEDERGPNIDPAAEPDEGPPREVTLGPYFLSKYEMTQGQWSRFAGTNPSRYRSLTHPVEDVTWDECDTILHRLGLFLPTEAQWEYAARGGTTSVFWTGDDRTSLDKKVNLCDLSYIERTNKQGVKHEPDMRDGSVAHAAIGKFPPNPFGFHEILGNNWEWCRDDWTKDFSTRMREGDGLKMLPSPSPERPYRGGSYYTTAPMLRCSNRTFGARDYHDASTGLRPLRTLEK